MMLVARTSFVAKYDGVEVALHRGKTHVADDHELARRFPHRFEPLPENEQLRYRDCYLMTDGRSVTDRVRLLDPPERESKQ